MIRLAGALFAVAVFASPLVEAQNSLIRGELRGAPGAGDQFSVTLISGAGPPETAYVGAGGSIQFHSIPQGTYQMEVRNMHGEVVKQQMLTVVGPSMETIITLTSALRAPRVASPSDGATVSLNRFNNFNRRTHRALGSRLMGPALLESASSSMMRLDVGLVPFSNTMCMAALLSTGTASPYINAADPLALPCRHLACTPEAMLAARKRPRARKNFHASSESATPLSDGSLRVRAAMC